MSHRAILDHLAKLAGVTLYFKRVTLLYFFAVFCTISLD